jgi:ABC-type nitrate/sulfonate/bicarbonate transport system permease component
MAVLLGVLLGAISGAVLAVNVVIFAGFERGYETTLSEVFDQRPVVAVIVVAVLALSPAIGGVVGFRRGRGSPG